MNQFTSLLDSFRPEPWVWVLLLLIASVILFIRNRI